MRGIPVMLAISIDVILFSSLTLMAQPQAEKEGEGPSRKGEARKISWQAKRAASGATVIPGVVGTGAGRFEFRWVIDARDAAALETPAGNKVRLFASPDGVSLLFTEKIPPPGEKTPIAVALAATVFTDDLFSVLAPAKKPPASPLAGKAGFVSWGGVQTRGGARYREGTVQASFGKLVFYWKTAAGRSPELVTLEAPGAGELPPAESRLFPWFDGAKGVTFIFQERFPLLNQAFAPSLLCLAAVKTQDLTAGLE